MKEMKLVKLTVEVEKTYMRPASTESYKTSLLTKVLVEDGKPDIDHLYSIALDFEDDLADKLYAEGNECDGLNVTPVTVEYDSVVHIIN